MSNTRDNQVIKLKAHNLVKSCHLSHDLTKNILGQSDFTIWNPCCNVICDADEIIKTHVFMGQGCLKSAVLDTSFVPCIVNEQRKKSLFQCLLNLLSVSCTFCYWQRNVRLYMSCCSSDPYENSDRTHRVHVVRIRSGLTLMVWLILHT